MSTISQVRRYCATEGGEQTLFLEQESPPFRGVLLSLLHGGRLCAAAAWILHRSWQL